MSAKHDMTLPELKKRLYALLILQTHQSGTAKYTDEEFKATQSLYALKREPDVITPWLNTLDCGQYAKSMIDNGWDSPYAVALFVNDDAEMNRLNISKKDQLKMKQCCWKLAS